MKKLKSAILVLILGFGIAFQGQASVATALVQLAKAATDVVPAIAVRVLGDGAGSVRPQARMFIESLGLTVDEVRSPADLYRAIDGLEVPDEQKAAMRAFLRRRESNPNAAIREIGDHGSVAAVGASRRITQNGRAGVRRHLSIPDGNGGGELGRLTDHSDLGQIAARHVPTDRASLTAKIRGHFEARGIPIPSNLSRVNPHRLAVWTLIMEAAAQSQDQLLRAFAEQSIAFRRMVSQASGNFFTGIDRFYLILFGEERLTGEALARMTEIIRRTSDSLRENFSTASGVVRVRVDQIRQSLRTSTMAVVNPEGTPLSDDFSRSIDEFNACVAG